jgi:hypothetical protein
MARKNKKEEQEEEYKESTIPEGFIEEDNRVCMFYVIERLDSIMEDCDWNVLRKFRDELVYNLGINSLNNKTTWFTAQNNITDYLE